MSNPSRTILLTGVTGQVGSELYHCLQHLGTVVPTINKGEAFAGKALELDLSDADSILAVVNEVRPDLIVNPAAYTAVDKAEQEEVLAMKVNARAPEIFAEWAKVHGASLVHFSTDYVYPGTGTQLYREDDTVGPLNVYGRSKLVGDEAVASIGGSYVILRTSWVYGIVGNNFVKTMLRLGGERESLQIVGDQIGAPTSARTLSDITSMILAATVSKHGFGALAERKGVYHAVNSGVTSWYEFAREIFRLAVEHGVQHKLRDGKSIATEAYPTPARRPKNSRLSLEKLSTTFQITPAAWDAALAWAMPFIVWSMGSGTNGTYLSAKPIKL